MALIDFILNLAGLVLWLNWRSVPLRPARPTEARNVDGTLRRAEPQRLQTMAFARGVGRLLLLRAGIYWQIGSAANWAGELDWASRAFVFQQFIRGRCCRFYECCCFSIFSFGLMLGVFYLWLLLLHPGRAGTPAFHRLVRMPPGRH